MKLIRNISLVMILLVALAVEAQIVLRHWDESTGLPSDQIRSFSTLDDGRIAARIPNGLIVFDGSDFNIHYINRGSSTLSDTTRKTSM